MIHANKTRLEKALIPFWIGMITCLVAFTILALMPSPISAQQPPALAGDYAGTLGPLHIKLHLKVNGAGKVTGTLDSPDRGAIGIHCADFNVDGQSVTFTVPAVQGMWKGTIAIDGTLTGTWDQGHSLPLNFARDTAEQAQKTFNASLH
jgi:hypothetical protein